MFSTDKAIIGVDNAPGFSSPQKQLGSTVGVSRRNVLVGGAAAVAAGVVGGEELTRQFTGDGSGHPAAVPVAGAGERQARPARLIGDGSTSYTGPQPFQPKPERLAPGERPPQFVVFSWDGAGEDDKKLFSHFRQVAQETKATMSFFLSGIYMLPRSQKMLYAPPGKPLGASAIGYLNDDHVKATIQQTSAAWLEGHDIGTHFNGHFCDSQGVGTWTPEQWRSEIDQAVNFVHTWRTNTGFHDVDALPFDYSKELVGGRTPCLEIMRRDAGVAAAILDNNLAMLTGIVEASNHIGMHTFDQYLQEMLAAEIIDEDTARAYAVNRHRLDLALRGIVTTQPILAPEPNR